MMAERPYLFEKLAMQGEKVNFHHEIDYIEGMKI